MREGTGLKDCRRGAKPSGLNGGANHAWRGYIIAIIVLLAIVIAVVVYLLHWLYRHSSKDLSFVRTGWGGEKVVMGGGALVLPIVHNITEVSMNTLRIEVKRTADKSLITANRMRIEVIVEFFVRVIPTAESVAAAARTLGSRTRTPKACSRSCRAASSTRCRPSPHDDDGGGA